GQRRRPIFFLNDRARHRGWSHHHRRAHHFADLQDLYSENKASNPDEQTYREGNTPPPTSRPYTRLHRNVRNTLCHVMHKPVLPQVCTTSARASASPPAGVLVFPSPSFPGDATHRASTFRALRRILIQPIRPAKGHVWRFEFQALARSVRSHRPWPFAKHRAPDRPSPDCAML